MRAEGDSLLVARYCVEESSADWVRSDLTVSVEFDRFKSILRFLFGSFELIPPEDLDRKYAAILEVLKKKQRLILETFPKIMNVKKDSCTLAELQGNLKYNEVQLSKEDYNILLIKLWRFSQNINELHFKRIFEVKPAN